MTARNLCSGCARLQKTPSWHIHSSNKFVLSLRGGCTALMHGFSIFLPAMPHQAGVAAWLVYIYAGNRCHCSLGLFHSELNQFEPVYPRGVDGLRRHLAKLLALFFNTTDLDSPDQTTVCSICPRQQ